jgi:hypothetical protein
MCLEMCLCSHRDDVDKQTVYCVSNTTTCVWWIVNDLFFNVLQIQWDVLYQIYNVDLPGHY